MTKINVKEFLNFTNKSIYEFLLFQNETEFEIIIPKESIADIDDRYSVVVDYVAAGFAGHLLNEIAVLCLLCPLPLRKNRFLFPGFCCRS